MSTAEFPEAKDPKTEEMRDELILLSTRGKIKYAEKFLKKASPKQLQKISDEYDRQQTEIIDELVSKHIIGALATMMKSFEYVDEKQCAQMKDTLLRNELLKRDLGELSNYLTRNIRYIGIATMVAVAGGYVISKKYGKQTEQERKQEQSEGPTAEDGQSSG